MISLKKFLVSSGIFTVVFFIIFVGCEAENPGEAIANKKPDTFISEANAGITTAISYYGTDTDGLVDTYAYKWDSDSEWTFTEKTNLTLVNFFDDQNEIKIFSVKAIDNLGAEDPTPAEIALSPKNILPNTSIHRGPKSGQIIGEDITFRFGGNDEPGGYVKSFQFTIDDTNTWQETPKSFPYATYLGLGEGPHTFYVRSIDNLNGADPTPAVCDFIVESGKFRPDIKLNFPRGTVDILITDIETTFSWEINVSHYHGMLPLTYISYSYDDSTNFNRISFSPLASGWNREKSFTFTPTAGQHTFYLKVRDTAGEVDTLSITFNVQQFNPTDGILLIDDFSWVPDGYNSDAHIDSLIANGFLDGYTFTQREDTDPGVKMSDIISYSTVILYSDNDFTNQTYGEIFAAFAKAGGNLLICGYNLWELSVTFPTYGLMGQVYWYGLSEAQAMQGYTGTPYDNYRISLPHPWTARIYYKVYTQAAFAQIIFRIATDNYLGYACAARSDMPQGNVVIVIGQSLPFMDQTLQDTKDLGNYILGTEFGETKK